MFNFKTVAIAAVLALTAGAASAATETFDFTKYDYNKSVNYFNDLHVKGSEGNVVKITSGTYQGKYKTTKVGQWKGYMDWNGVWRGGGLGVCSNLKKDGQGCKESHTIDGSGSNEYLKFDFGDRNIKITNIMFGDYGYGDDKFSLNNSAGTNALHTDFYRKGDQWNGVYVAGNSFFIGIKDDKTFAKIRKITIMDVSEVPLPAAGWMLIAGLGGLAAMRRKKA